jgi:hypothetical protein
MCSNINFIAMFTNYYRVAYYFESAAATACIWVALIRKVADYITLAIFFKFKLNRLLVTNHKGLAMAQAVSRRLHTTVARFTPRSVHVGYAVDKVAMQ